MSDTKFPSRQRDCNLNKYHILDDSEQGNSDSPAGPAMLLKWNIIAWMNSVTWTHLHDLPGAQLGFGCGFGQSVDTVPTAFLLRAHIIIHVAVILRQSLALILQRVKVDLDRLSLHIAAWMENDVSVSSALIWSLDYIVLHEYSSIHFNCN